MNNAQSFDWTEPKTKDAVARWNMGESCTTIGRSYGISRNAVVGKMKRLRAAGWDIRVGIDTKPLVISEKKFQIMPRATEDWTEPQTANLITDWNAGKSAVQIADETGRTHSSVKAKLERLHKRGLIIRGLARKSVAVKPGPKQRPKPTKPQEVYGVRETRPHGPRNEARVDAYTKAGVTSVAQFEARMTGVGIPLLQIGARQCRFPTGHGPDWLMCGEPVESGSYCPSCSARVNGRAAA